MIGSQVCLIIPSACRPSHIQSALYLRLYSAFVILLIACTHQANLHSPRLMATPGPNPSVSGITVSPDLTNRKLARNQAELSRQLTELRVLVEAQAELLRTFIENGRLS